MASSASRQPDRNLIQVRLVDFHRGTERDVDDWSSHGVRATGLVKVEASSDITLLHFDAGAVLGRHPTGRPQLFAIVAGDGWVSGPDGVRHSVAAGQAAFWERGEAHESGSEGGMTVIVIQGDRLDPEARPS